MAVRMVRLKLASFSRTQECMMGSKLRNCAGHAPCKSSVKELPVNASKGELRDWELGQLQWLQPAQAR